MRFLKFIESNFKVIIYAVVIFSIIRLIWAILKHKWAKAQTPSVDSGKGSIFPGTYDPEKYKGVTGGDWVNRQIWAFVDLIAGPNPYKSTETKKFQSETPFKKVANSPVIDETQPTWKDNYFGPWQNLNPANWQDN